MKVKELIEQLKKFNPDLEVVAGKENDNEILRTYTCNIYQGQGKPDKHCVWIDCKQDDADF